jgi:hypothetical protein
VPDLTFDEFKPQGKAPPSGGSGDLTFEEFNPGAPLAPDDPARASAPGHTKAYATDGTPIAPPPPKEDPGYLNSIKSGIQSGAGGVGDIRETLKSYLPEKVQPHVDALFRRLASNPATGPLFGGGLGALSALFPGGALTTQNIADITGHEQTEPQGLGQAAVQGGTSMATNPLSYLGPGGAASKALGALGGGSGAGVGGQVAGTPGAVLGGALGGLAGGSVGNLIPKPAPRPPTPVPGIPHVDMMQLPTQRDMIGNVRGAYGAAPISSNPALKPRPLPPEMEAAAPTGGEISNMVKTGHGLPAILGGLAGGYLGHATGIPGAREVLAMTGANVGPKVYKVAAPAAKAVGRNLDLGAALRGGILGSQIGP